MTPSRRLPVRYAALVAGMTAVLGGGALALWPAASPSSGHSAPGGVTAQDASVSLSACNALDKRISKKLDEDVDVDDALRCDQREFAALEKARLSGKTDNRVRLSATCTQVNKRVAKGDLEVDEDLATACRTRELFAIDTDVSNELGSGDRLTSMCVAKQKLGTRAPAFEKKACTDKKFGRQPLPVSEEPVTPSPTPSDAVPSPTGSASQDPPAVDIAKDCDPVRTAIAGNQKFDDQTALKCAKAEVTTDENGDITKASDVCVTVDLRARAGDLAMPADLVRECQQQLTQVDPTPGNGTKDRSQTGICVTVRNQVRGGGVVDLDLLKACAKELAN